jgi:hypothetical protein
MKVCLVLRVGGSAEAGLGSGEVEVREDLGWVLAQQLPQQVRGLLEVFELEFALAETEERRDVVGFGLEDGPEDGLGLLPLA